MIWPSQLKIIASLPYLQNVCDLCIPHTCAAHTCAALPSQLGYLVHVVQMVKSTSQSVVRTYFWVAFVSCRISWDWLWNLRWHHMMSSTLYPCLQSKRTKVSMWLAGVVLRTNWWQSRGLEHTLCTDRYIHVYATTTYRREIGILSLTPPCPPYRDWSSDLCTLRCSWWLCSTERYPEEEGEMLTSCSVWYPHCLDHYNTFCYCMYSMTISGSEGEVWHYRWDGLTLYTCKHTRIHTCGDNAGWRNRIPPLIQFYNQGCLDVSGSTIYIRLITTLQVPIIDIPGIGNLSAVTACDQFKVCVYVCRMCLYIFNAGE